MIRWLLTVALLLGCKHRDQRLSPDRKTYSFAEHEGTTRVPDLYRRASALLEKDDYPGAGALYRQAIDAEPGKPMGYVGLATCEMSLGRLDESERLYQKAAALDARASSPLVGLGAIAGLRGRFRDSVQLYEKALAIDENNADAHWGAAISYQSLGEKEPMRSHARRFIALAPDSMLVSRATQMLLQ